MNIIWVILSGICFSNFLDNLGILNENEAVYYYGEVHQSRWNCVIHNIGMPIVVYGVMIWLPYIFNIKNPFKMQRMIYMFYIFHYLWFNILGGIIVGVCYLPVMEMSFRHYDYSFSRFCYGFTVMTITLIIQEYLGHYIGGDNPSRAEGVLNAIIYAPYYSVNWWRY